jgi:hypothetical protein
MRRKNKAGKLGNSCPSIVEYTLKINLSSAKESAVVVCSKVGGRNDQVQVFPYIQLDGSVFLVLPVNPDSQLPLPLTPSSSLSPFSLKSTTPAA